MSGDDETGVSLLSDVSGRSPAGQGPSPAAGRRRRGFAVDPYVAATLIAVGLILGWKLSDLDARALWFDEAFSWQLTQFSWKEMIARAGLDVHPPLYYVVLRLWTGLAGDSVFAMRVVSVAWFGVALWAAFHLCRTPATGPGLTEGGGPARAVGRDDAGWITVLLLCSSAFLLRFTQEIRMYAQLMALLMLSGWSLLRALERRPGRWPWWAAYVLSATAMAYTHYLGLFSMVAQACYAAGVLTVRAGGFLRPLVRDPKARSVAAAYLAIAALYLPWLPTLRFQRSQVSDNYWAPSVTSRPPLDLELWRVLVERCTLHDKAVLIPDYPASNAYEFYLGYALLEGVLITLALLAASRDPARWYALAAVAIPADLAIINSYLVGRNLIEHRYLIASFAMLMVGLGLLIGGIPRRPLRWLVAGWVSLNLLCHAAEFQHALDLPNRPEMRGAADLLAARVKPGDAVLCLDPLSYHPLKYHARGRFAIRQLRRPKTVINHYNGSPIFRNDDFLAEADLPRMGARRIWTVDRGGPPPAVAPWRLSTKWTFPESIRWFGELELKLWEKREGDEKGGGRRTASGDAPAREGVKKDGPAGDPAD